MTNPPIPTHSELTPENPASMIELIRRRIGQEFDGEAHFTEVEAVKIISLLDQIAAYREALEEAVQLVEDLSSELESEIVGRYDGLLPQLERRYDRDMGTVEHAKASLPGLRQALSIPSTDRADP